MVMGGLNSVCFFVAFRPFETTNTFSPVVAVHCAIVGAKKKHIIDGNTWLTWQALPCDYPMGRSRSSGKCNHKRFHDQKHLGLKKRRRRDLLKRANRVRRPDERMVI